MSSIALPGMHHDIATSRRAGAAVEEVTQTAPLDVLFVIRELDYGGAERQLVALACELHRRGHRVRVAVFYPVGEGMRDLAAAGVPVLSLDKGGRWDVLPFLVRLARLFRRERPAIVHGYLGFPNTLAVLMRPVHRAPVVWGARASDIEVERYDWLARLDDRIERRLARRPALIVANSEAGRRHLLERGFPPESMVVIHNGIDIQRFRPHPAARSRVRAELGLTSEMFAIGRIGRIDPQKDYPTFLRAAAVVAQREPLSRFICAGYDPHGLQAGLAMLAEELGLTGKVSWLGQRHDMEAVFNALDLNVSSSAWGEGTPNSIAEGMACGVPAVVTDSGDSAWTVGTTGFVTPAGDPHALAEAILAMRGRIERGEIDGELVRDRILESMSLESLARQTEAALARVVGGDDR